MVKEQIASALAETLGGALVAVAVHGSGVTGDAFAGLSDLDFVVVLKGVLSPTTSAEVAEALDRVSIEPYAYLQATYHDAGHPEPSIVPGAYRRLLGDSKVLHGFEHSAASLRASGERWLGSLSDLRQQDIEDWSFSTGRRPRQLRLVLTRVKPTVRAVLVVDGVQPLDAYRAPWPELVAMLNRTRPGAASRLSDLVESLGDPDHDPHRSAGIAFALLDELTRS